MLKSIFCYIQPRFIILARRSTQRSLLYDLSAVMLKAQRFRLAVYGHTKHVVKHYNPSSSLALWYWNVSSSQEALQVLCAISKCLKNIAKSWQHCHDDCHDLHRHIFFILNSRLVRIHTDFSITSKCICLDCCRHLWHLMILFSSVESKWYIRISENNLMSYQ